MFRTTITLLLVGCCLTAYRLISEPLSIAALLPVALAEPATNLSRTETIVTTSVDANVATPTVAPLFLAQTSQPASPTAQAPTVPVTLKPTPQTSAAQRQAPGYPEVLIYDNQLHGSWSIDQSTKSAINLATTDVSFQSLDPEQRYSSGAAAIAVTPEDDFGKLFFTVRPESGAVYKRQDVLGVSLWLNSGATGIATDDLAIAVIGSNDYSYWKPADHSVFPENQGAFSETRLYFLQINRTIPPHTWLNLVVWLDDLQYDPAYKYVTGFYLKNDAGFRSTYYLDQVALLMAP